MTERRKVEILNIKKTDMGFFQIEEAHLRHERFDGSMSKEITRLNLRRGDATAAVVHDPRSDSLIFTEQFRYPTYGKDSGWLLELPAGVVENDKDSDPAETMRRELVEEIGYSIATLRHIHTFFVSPGGSSERIFLFYASVAPDSQISTGGGLVSEGEDIRVVTMSTAQAFDRMAAGEFSDAKTIIGLQWLKLNKASLGG